MDRLEKIAKLAAHYRVFRWRDDGQRLSRLTRLGRATDQCSLVMDIEYVDKLHNLDFDAMLADIDSYSVAHDVIGIYKHFDRQTKQLTDCWSPRYGRDREHDDSI